jgi:hypothetical protein
MAGKTGRVQQNVVRDNRKPHGSGDVQIEFTPDSAHVFNFSVNGWFGKWPDNSEQHNQRFSANETLLEDFRQNVATRSPTLGVDLNLGYTRKFKKPVRNCTSWRNITARPTVSTTMQCSAMRIMHCCTAKSTITKT